METTSVNYLYYFPTAHEYMGKIAGRWYTVKDPQELLDIALEQHPHLLFKLERKL